MKNDRMRPDQFAKLESDFFAYVVSEEEANGQTTLSAKTTEGILKLKFWGAETPKPGNYLLLSANDRQNANQEYEDWKSIRLDSKYNKPTNLAYRTAEESEIPEKVRKKINRDRKPQLAAAMEALKDPSPWKNKETHALLLNFIGENEKKFFNAPAAVSKHHNWRGGLLVHTAEVATNCLAIASGPMNGFYEINTDALLLAAWLHDAGKMEVYQMNGASPEIDGEMESLIGHQTISNLMFREIASKNGLDPALANLVSHCILSHHERREWGAVVEPQTIEAHILCRADFISSRMPD